jgi:hypothetical protein
MKVEVRSIPMRGNHSMRVPWQLPRSARNAPSHRASWAYTARLTLEIGGGEQNENAKA